MSRYKWRRTTCEVCGKDFSTSRSDTRYCSAPCRKRAAYARVRMEKQYYDILNLIKIVHKGGGEGYLAKVHAELHDLQIPVQEKLFVRRSWEE